MRRSLIAAALAAPLAAALAACTLPAIALAQGKQDFALVNRTGYQIDQVYVSSSANSNWGRDLLGSNVLRNGGVFNVSFGRNTQDCSWDIKVVYNDGDTSEFRRVNLCQVSRVNLFWDRQRGQTRATVE
jgi:hypothetical protein